MTLVIPSSSAHAVSFRIRSMWQYRLYPARIASTIVPTTSRTFGATQRPASSGEKDCRRSGNYDRMND